jgi:spore coat polysaccharide biosynthesis protein SpsF (cytidylyltransferase family)
MKIGFAVLCRYSSRRLPGKILREICGRPVLDHIVDRLRSGVPGIPVAVATSDQPDDDPVASRCATLGVDCHRGSIDDVAGRFLDCAESRGWDFAVRVNGDNLFADVALLRRLIDAARTDAYDFITNVPGRTYPYGMSVEVLRTSFYRDVMQATTDPEDREHVTRRLYAEPDLGRRFTAENHDCPEARGLALALDTPEDFDRLQAVMATMVRPPHEYDLRDVARLARTVGCF